MIYDKYTGIRFNLIHVFCYSIEVPVCSMLPVFLQERSIIKDDNVYENLA